MTPWTTPSKTWIYILCKCQVYLVLSGHLELEYGNVGFWGEGETGVSREKPLGADKENQQQTEPTYHEGSANRTRDTMV